MACNFGSSQLGNYLGTVGSQLGDRVTGWGNAQLENARKRIKNWTGLGDYKIAANSLITGTTDASAAQIMTEGRGIRVTFREYLGEVYTGASAGAFNPVTYEVNPANVITFPWVSTIAQQYDQYRPLGIIFEFKSTATDSTTSASLGSIMIATEYDVNESDYSNKQEMMNSAFASETKLSENLLHGIECDPAELGNNIYFTRPLGVEVTNKKDYDICRTTVATQGGGLAANSSVGSLYVHYDFLFYKEQIYGGLQAKNLIYQFSERQDQSSGAYDWPGWGMVRQGMWGTDPNITKFGGQDLGIYADGNTIYIPARWAGATFIVHCNFLWAAGYTIVGTTGGINTGLTLRPDILDRIDAFALGSGFYGQRDVGLLTNNSKRVTAFTLHSNIVGTHATHATLLPGFIPNGDTNSWGAWTFMIVPTDGYLS